MFRNPAKIGNSGYTQGEFSPKNPQKYIGRTAPVFRSSWERDCMFTFDMNPAIIQWAVEPFSIPYIHPLTGTVKQYFPDFLICFMQKDGTIRRELIEIKPAKETMVESARSRRDKVNILINQAKWAAAQKFCNANGLSFRVLTEQQIYRK